MNHNPYLPRSLPEPLQGLADLALDLRWSWNHSADSLWQALHPELWEATGNAWLILETVSQQRLEELAGNNAFLEELNQQLGARKEYLAQTTWFDTTHGGGTLKRVAYFSMEFGLGEALPIYSGGLGVLAGDYMKTASDLGIPVAGVGLLYQQGYFRQALNAGGEQLVFYPYNDPIMLPIMPVWSADGSWLHVNVELPGRTLRLRAWQVQVGRNLLYLLDSNDPLNTPGDRGITSELYGGGSEMRLQQELVLGIGGWRLLAALGVDCEVCHLNEGHAAFAILERARSLMRVMNQPFAVTLRASRIGNLFTTHTPVPAGFDSFAPDLINQYLGTYAATLGISIDMLLGMGRTDPHDREEPFNMAYLAMRGCGDANGVSRLHGEVSRRLFQPLYPHWPQADVPLGHVTNGVHVPSWDSAPADKLWTQACGKDRWLGALETLDQEFMRVPDEALWEARGQARRAMVSSARRRLAHQRAARGEDAHAVAECADLLDPNALTLGFARRFTAYKRPNLLLRNPERLTRLLIHSEHPVQLVIAGKAHPQDEEGQRLIRAWAEYIRRPEIRGHVVFVEDYDIALAAELVQGVDVWVNTPLRPWEASGTSGMKVLVNGGLNLSELDGWWAEAFDPAVGWAIGDGREHDHDRAWDLREADELYNLLEKDVIPAFYERNANGLPERWVAHMRESMARLTPRFSANRMVREYTEVYYLDGAANYRERTANAGAVALELEEWHGAITRHWPQLHFGNLDVTHTEENYTFTIQVYLDELPPDAVAVELYADARDEAARVVHPMKRGEALAGSMNGFSYRATVPTDRPASHYTPRLVPFHAHAQVPMEASQILWPT